jgi:predicted DNA-binding transcriptional regulator YafY
VNAEAGRAGGYQLGAGAALPPLLLSDDEALAVTLALRTAATGSVTGMEEAAVRALAKLEPMLPARLRRRVSALGSAVVGLLQRGPSIDPELLSTLAVGCRDQHELSFRYSDSQARETERTIEPHGLVYYDTRWYLVAWDLMREAFRTFRVDRIAPGPLPASGRRFLRRAVPYGSPAAYVARSVSSGVYTYKARVVLHAPMSALSRIAPYVGQLERIDDQRCQLETGSHSLTMLGIHLLSLGVDFEVQEPPELIEYLRVLAQRLQWALK